MKKMSKLDFTEKQKKLVPELKSPRILKSATPKYTLDWYVKWIASVLVLAAMSTRGMSDLLLWDLSLSVVGISLWLWVSIMWNDRALILLYGIGLLFLLRNLTEYLFWEK